MKITSPKNWEIHKMFEYIKIFFKIHFEFLDNKHEYMKVVDALEQIC